MGRTCGFADAISGCSAAGEAKMTMHKRSGEYNRKAVGSWCVYDWANSAFTTLVVTFVYSTYFSQAFAPDERLGTALWSRGIVVSSIVIALLSPIVGAMADRGGRRRRYLILTTLICVTATALLAFVKPSHANAALVALTIFVIANVMFELGIVFYNSFLPAIAPADKIGRISGYGWGLGYAGGLLCMVVGLLGFVGISGLGLEPWFALSDTENFNVRATNLLVAGWFLLFSIPMFLFVRDAQGPRGRLDVKGALSDLRQTFQEIQRYREVVKFLIARLIYNDGLVTIFAFGGIYAAGTFGMSFTDVMIFGIVLNAAAGLGAFLFGFFDDRMGGRVTILVSLVALSASAVVAVIAPSRMWLWVAGIGVGIFAGPNQSASRSLMGRFVPERHQAEFFGFFAFSGKATAFLGPLLLGTVSGAFGQRLGVSTVLLFFVIGGALLLLVNEQRGIEAAAVTNAE
jgi:UMF1 family MFS transporter